jgi:hypothetical protein
MLTLDAPKRRAVVSAIMSRARSAFGTGGLIFKRFAQLIEQPRILDCDNGLIGEGRHQLDLLVGKRLHNRSPDEDHPYDIALPQERGSERRSITANPLVLKVSILRIDQHVGNMNQSAFKRRSSNDTASIHRNRMLFDVFLIFGRKAITCGDTEEFAVT